MRILVQDCKTLEFVNRNGTRTKKIGDADNFGSTVAALNFCQKTKFDDLQILMKFDREEFDVKLPVSATCKGQAVGI